MNPIQDPQGAQDRESLLEDSNTQDADLAPIDGGRAAWVFLAGCCLVEAVMWGKQRDVARALTILLDRHVHC